MLAKRSNPRPARCRARSTGDDALADVTDDAAIEIRLSSILEFIEMDFSKLIHGAETNRVETLTMARVFRQGRFLESRRGPHNSDITD